MSQIGKRTRAVGQRVMRALVLGQVLPTLLLTPSQAGAVLLHSHCDESHHAHVLAGVELTKWANTHATEHHCATGEPDTCCETSESPNDPGGVVLHCPPMLVCRVRSVDTAALQPTLDASVSQVAAACVSALLEPAGALPDISPPRRCLDALISSSHALLI